MLENGFEDASMIKLTDGFMALYNNVEMQKRRIEDTYRVLEERQKILIAGIVSQLELDDGSWKVDMETNMLVKNREEPVNDG